MEFIKKNKLILSMILISFAFGFGVCFLSIKQKTQIKTEYKEKIVTKVVKIEVEKKQEKKNTYTKITEKPDGSKETIIQETTESNSETAKKNKDLSKTEIEKTTIKINKTASLGFMLSIDTKTKSYKDYGLFLKYQVISPVSVQSVYMFEDRSFYIGASIDF